MGRQQFEVLRGVVRQTLQRRFNYSQRSGSDGGLLEGTKPVASSPAGSNSRFKTLNPRSRYTPARNSAAEVSGDCQILTEKGLEQLFPSHLRRGLYVDFCLGPAVASHVSNFIRVFGSTPTVSRGLASLSGVEGKAEEKVVETVVADGFRRDGQGGDEGHTASISGRESAVKKPRRKKANAPETDREVSIKATNGSPELKDLELALSEVHAENVAPRPATISRRKRSKETIASVNTGLTAVAVEDAEALAAASVESSISSTMEGGNASLESVSVDGQSSPPTPIFGMDAVAEIPGPRNVPVGASEKILTAFSNYGWSDPSEFDSEKGASSAPANSKSYGASMTRNDQELRMSSFTSVVEEHLKDLQKQNMIKSLIANQTPQELGATKSGNKFTADPLVESADYTDPTKVYQILQASRGGRAFQGQDKAKLNNIFHRFSVSGWVSDQALSLYINSKFFPSATSRFRKFFLHRSSHELRSYMISKGPTNEALQFIFPSFAEFCIQEFSDEIRRYRELVSTADMTKPDAWYPFARAMKRKVVYHKGPTNSGKTYRALKRLMEAQSGIYCSPLRLLAMEVFDTVNVQGIYCNLHTGQEKKDVPFANHLACTIEMCYLNKQWEVAVIDEIQMMSDEYRGWAWTRAFLGLQADEIHVCGDPSALPLIRNLCAGTGDELVENEYERFKPLKVSEESLRGDFRNIQAGDCIVAFSRRDIFDIKREVELATKHRCCVVYGALPPETRTQQAKLFNEQDNGYDVLVASDAIGMGLNLNIRRVVFFSLDKFDGDSKKPVPPAQVKQIAGRAGRRGSIYPEGVTTTFFSQDLAYLGSSLLQDFEPSTAAGLFPVYEQVELFASQLPNENFAKLLERFSETCKLDGAYFLCRYDNLKRVANMLEKVKGLSLEDRFNFCFAPVNVRDPQSMGALYRYATAFSQKIPVHVEMGVPSSSARDEFELLDLEARHQVLSMYLWLSQHFPGDLFPQKEQAGEMASQIAVLLGQSLVQSSRRWSKRKLPPTHTRGRLPPNMAASYNRKSPTWNGGLRKAVPGDNVVRV